MDKKRWDRAINLRDAGQWEAALCEFRALEEFPECKEERFDLLINQAWCLSGLDRFQEARDCLREASNLHIDEIEYCARIDLLDACLDRTEGKAKEALRKMEVLLKKYADFLQTQNPRYIYEEAQMSRGCLLAYLGRFKEACPILEEVLACDIAKHGDFYFHLGHCYLRLDKTNDAKTMLSKAFELGLEGGWAVTGHYYLGSCYLKLGAYARAMKELEAAESIADRLNEPKKPIYEALFKASKALGLNSEAARYGHLLKNTRSDD